RELYTSYCRSGTQSYTADSTDSRRTACTQGDRCTPFHLTAQYVQQLCKILYGAGACRYAQITREPDRVQDAPVFQVFYRPKHRTRPCQYSCTGAVHAGCQNERSVQQKEKSTVGLQNGG